MSYSPGSIHINDREIKLAEILSGTTAPLSDFESQTFLFIKAWLTGTDLFTLYTSGSTGTPKEITLTRNQLKQSAWRTIKTLELKQDDTALVCLDTKYIAGKMMLVRALENNMKIIAVEPSSNPLLSLKEDIPIHFAAFVPMQLEDILKNTETAAALNKIKIGIIGGASINRLLEQKLNAMSCAFYSTYGMTETVSHIALQRLNGKERNDHLTILPGIQIEKDERGCLVIRMPEFEEKIVTNDLVELIDTENFRWLGRWDTVINSGGFKISPEKVENRIDTIFASLGFYRPHFIAGIPDDRLGQKPVLFIEGSLLLQNEEDLLLKNLRGTLHKYEVPKQIFYVPEFIRTETGKINRIETIRIGS